MVICFGQIFAFKGKSQPLESVCFLLDVALLISIVLHSLRSPQHFITFQAAAFSGFTCEHSCDGSYISRNVSEKRKGRSGPEEEYKPHTDTLSEGLLYLKIHRRVRIILSGDGGRERRGGREQRARQMWRALCHAHRKLCSGAEAAVM